ncbi:hypothetical protein [uncultured Cellulomonas sp.]|uniref:hypothetical protein n=1 Tax=uncultured Cellulomonas sp. TaxID=189682 RepID=UPI002615DE0D|nr:hypothetical protein [uncultured Cellulomonas sp.]
MQVQLREQDIEHLRPWNLLQLVGFRSELRAARRDAVDTALAVERTLSDSTLTRRVAAEAIHTTIRAHRAHSHRHKYHREILAELDHLVRAIAADLRAPGGLPLAYEHVTLDEMPPALQAELTLDQIRRHITTAVAHYEQVADDPVLLTQWRRPGRDLVVQHQASGLRAQFLQVDSGPADVGAMGTILSKPYRVGSVDPQGGPDPSGDNWQRYAGLGIGRRIYLEGARLMPAIRWQASAASPHARGVRAHLHRQDPYTWAHSGCEWCSSRHLDWGRTPRQSFSGHPY